MATLGPAAPTTASSTFSPSRDDLGADAVAADDGEVEGGRGGLAHGVQPRERYRDADGRPSPWAGGTAGRAALAIGPTSERGARSLSRREWPWSRRSIDSWRAWRARVASSRVLFSFIGDCLPRPRGPVDREGCVGLEPSDASANRSATSRGLRGEGADYLTSPRLAMRRSTSSRCMPRRYVDVLVPVRSLSPSGRCDRRDVCHIGRRPADSVARHRPRPPDPCTWRHVTSPTSRLARTASPGIRAALGEPASAPAGGPSRSRRESACGSGTCCSTPTGGAARSARPCRWPVPSPSAVTTSRSRRLVQRRATPVFPVDPRRAAGARSPASGRAARPARAPPSDAVRWASRIALRRTHSDAGAPARPPGRRAHPGPRPRARAGTSRAQDDAWSSPPGSPSTVALAGLRTDRQVADRRRSTTT